MFISYLKGNNIQKKDQPPTAGLKIFIRVVFSIRVKALLRVPKAQRETFLNNIVTANTVFLEKFTKKRYDY
ncbi:hypothetical protein CV014_11260 [Nostoc sp. CMAA1605]|nr:hypothetical protein [Nostoc sp. CMAA1605]